MTPYRYVLLPGRHHLLTRAQAGYLRHVLAGRATADDGGPVDVDPSARVVWAVTSANHQNTRRNPVLDHFTSFPEGFEGKTLSSSSCQNLIDRPARRPDSWHPPR